MIVTLLTSSPCNVCGYVRTGVMVASARVNKRSMRTYGTNLVMLPGRCLECCRDTPWPPSVTWRVEPKDAQKIQAYRLRRWPELSAELAQARAG